jgi:hypothetical protein
MDVPSLRMVMQHAAEFGTVYQQSFLNAVPEPVTVTLIPLAIFTVARRSRRRAR